MERPAHPSAPVRRPRPVPTELTREFWDAAAAHNFRVQRCTACRRWFHPPVPVCSRCHSDQLHYETVSGRGTINSYTVMVEPLVPGFEAAVPLAVVVVELEEQEHLVVVSNLVGFHGVDVEVGAAVEVTFEDLPNGGGTLPQFRLAGSVGP